MYKEIKLLKEQLELSQEIIDKAKINIVTCGNCSGILLHRTSKTIEELECPYCNFKSDICDYPDLFYPNFWE